MQRSVTNTNSQGSQTARQTYRRRLEGRTAKCNSCGTHLNKVLLHCLADWLSGCGCGCGCGCGYECECECWANANATVNAGCCRSWLFELSQVYPSTTSNMCGVGFIIIPGTVQLFNTKAFVALAWFSFKHSMELNCCKWQRKNGDATHSEAPVRSKTFLECLQVCAYISLPTKQHQIME